MEVETGTTMKEALKESKPMTKAIKVRTRGKGAPKKYKDEAARKAAARAASKRYSKNFRSFWMRNDKANDLVTHFNETSPEEYRTVGDFIYDMAMAGIKKRAKEAR